MNSEVEITGTARRVWGFWATIGFGIVIIAVLLVIQILTAGIFAAIKFVPSQDFSPGVPALDDIMVEVEGIISSYEGLIVSLSTFVVAVVGVGLILVIIRVRRGAGFAEYLGLRGINARTVLMAIVVIAAYIMLSGLLNTLLEKPVPESMLNVYRTSVWPVLFWLAVVVFTPVFEEIFFRGFLFEGFYQSRIGSAGAIGLTSISWALLHFQYDLHGMLEILVMGIILGIMRLKSRSLWGPVIMHALNNAVATFLVALYVNGLAG